MSTVEIGGVSINPSILWNKRLSANRLAQVAKRTVGGRLVIFQQALQNGEAIDLEATEETGWVDYSAVQDLIALANAGGIYPFTYRDYTGQVMFRFTDGAAVEMELLRPCTNPQPTDKCFGVIRLITV